LFDYEQYTRETLETQDEGAASEETMEQEDENEQQETFDRQREGNATDEAKEDARTKKRREREHKFAEEAMQIAQDAHIFGDKYSHQTKRFSPIP
jgi:septin family protein